MTSPPLGSRPINENDASAVILRDFFGLDVFGTYSSRDTMYEEVYEGRAWSDWGLFLCAGYREPGYEVEGYPPNYQYKAYIAHRMRGSDLSMSSDLRRAHPWEIEWRARTTDPHWWIKLYRTYDPVYRVYGRETDPHAPTYQRPRHFYLRPDLGPANPLDDASDGVRFHSTHPDAASATLREVGLAFWDGEEHATGAYDIQGQEYIDPSHPASGQLYRPADYMGVRELPPPPPPYVPEPPKFDVLRYSRYKSEGRDTRTRASQYRQPPATEQPPPPPPPEEPTPEEPTPTPAPAEPVVFSSEPVSYPLVPIPRQARNDHPARAWQLDVDYRQPPVGASGRSEVVSTDQVGWTEATYRSSRAAWWYFDIPAGETRNVRLDSLGTTGDSYLGLYLLADNGGLTSLGEADDNAGDADGLIQQNLGGPQETRLFVVVGPYTTGALVPDARVNFIFTSAQA